MNRRTLLILLAALLLPVVLVAAATYLDHAGSLPPDRDWPVYAIVIGLVIGVAAIAQLPLHGTFKRLAVLFVYLPLWSTVLLAVSYITACFRGDCGG